MRAYGELKAQRRSFLTSALDRGVRSASCSDSSTPRKHVNTRQCWSGHFAQLKEILTCWESKQGIPGCPVCTLAIIMTIQLNQYAYKCEVLLRNGHEGPKGEKMYSSTLPSTLALDWGGWSTPHTGRFSPGKDPVPIVRGLGGPQDRSGRMRKISPQPGFDPRIVQPVASRYTD